MTKGEVSKYALEITECEAAGEEVTMKRKERSDKRKKRDKRTAEDVDPEKRRLRMTTGSFQMMKGGSKEASCEEGCSKEGSQVSAPS
jgi:hypothetical protein